MAIEYVSFLKKRYAQKELRSISPYLEELKERDQKQFGWFLQSPFFNKDERLCQLYEALMAAKRNSDKKKEKQQKQATHLNGKTLLKKWHKPGQQELNIELVPKKIKELQRLITDYFAHQHLKDSMQDRTDILYRRFRNQGVPLILEKVKKEKEKKIKAASIGVQKLIDSYLMSHHAYYEFNTNHEQNGLTLMLGLVDNLEDFYQTMKMVYATELQNLKRAFTRQDAALIGSEFSILSTELRGWFKSYMAIYDTDGHFSQKGIKSFMNKLLLKNKELDPLIRYILCKYTVNALSDQVTKGHDQYKEDLLAWLRRRVDWAPKSLAKVDSNEYLNLITVSCHCGDVDLAREYARENISRLPAEDSKYAIQLGEAHCCFFERRYDETRTILEEFFKRFSVKYYKYTLRAKTLLIRACLADELSGNDGYEGFLKIKGDFRVFLNRLVDKISSSQLDAYRNFLHVCNKIFLAQKIKPNENVADRQSRFLALQEETAQTPIIACKQWLIDIITQQLK